VLASQAQSTLGQGMSHASPEDAVHHVQSLPFLLSDLKEVPGFSCVRTVCKVCCLLKPRKVIWLWSVSVQIRGFGSWIYYCPHGKVYLQLSRQATLQWRKRNRKKGSILRRVVVGTKGTLRLMIPFA
jgi:hypothetical protein